MKLGGFQLCRNQFVVFDWEPKKNGKRGKERQEIISEMVSTTLWPVDCLTPTNCNAATHTKSFGYHDNNQPRNPCFEFVQTMFEFSRSRPRIEFSESQQQVQDWSSLSLNVKTETERKIILVSMSRPKLGFSESHYWDHNRDKDFLVSISS